MTTRHPLLGKRVRFVKRGVLGYATRQWCLPSEEFGQGTLFAFTCDLDFLQFTADSGEVQWLYATQLEAVAPHCPAEIEELLACCPAKP